MRENDEANFSDYAKAVAAIVIFAVGIRYLGESGTVSLTFLLCGGYVLLQGFIMNDPEFWAATLKSEKSDLSHEKCLVFFGAIVFLILGLYGLFGVLDLQVGDLPFV